MTDTCVDYSPLMDEIWDKFDVLRGRCDVRLKSFTDERGLMVWSASIVNPAWPERPIECTDADISVAVRTVVDKAEAAGWLGEPKPTPPTGRGTLP